ncbi:hypothetical protein [Spiroplasma platyhelix]|uniref:Uncharacterized protein n=1 Tax=Spiroplasma platyhelix PALS-1 TaxID=1276218 RepID=A0A846U0Q2_9MOLU|nr:hypothetical protein [Spiroplasma platyhelix]MBE4704035.1 hypothetical protein [Spiroplasma platyhelix PALS-1]NKE38406.1 hypothetical protein [Spiroplasma platyhelix PALS-1]UJB29293.1 hypothetical protein SPLAT_v1c05290 [Spiroplasma platyhelix PALS-1]
MKKWCKKKIEETKKWFDKWLKNRVEYKINEENNKHDSQSAKEFDDRSMNFLSEVFGDDLIKKNSAAYKRKKAEYQNDSTTRKVVVEVETVDQVTKLHIDDKFVKIDKIETTNNDKIEDTEEEREIKRIENETDETNFYKEARGTEEKDN